MTMDDEEPIHAIEENDQAPIVSAGEFLKLPFVTDDEQKDEYSELVDVEQLYFKYFHNCLLNISQSSITTSVVFFKLF